MSISFLFHLTIIFAVQCYLWASGRANLQSLPSVAAIIYFIVVYPKMVLFLSIGQEAFISSSTLSSGDVKTAAMLIFVFVVSLQVPYLFGASAGRAGIQFWNGPISEFSPRPFGVHKVQYLYFSVFLPASIIFLGFFALQKGFSFRELLSKVEFVSEDGYTALYFVQKFGFFVKVPFYAILLKLLTRGQFTSFSDKVVLVLSTTCTIALFLFSGQRSGILLTMFELLMVLNVIGKLSFRLIFFMTLTFAGINFLVLSLRFFNIEGVSFAQMFLRRYFFDIEKIALIFKYFSDGGGIFGYSTYYIVAGTKNTAIMENIHFFLGKYIFLTRAGVPPSLLGEVLIYLGSAFIIPVTLTFSFMVKKAEILIKINRLPLLTMSLIVAVSHGIYFSLNSDSISFLRRTGLDLVVLICAYLFFKMFLRWPKATVSPAKT